MADRQDRQPSPDAAPVIGEAVDKEEVIAEWRRLGKGASMKKIFWQTGPEGRRSRFDYKGEQVPAAFMFWREKNGELRAAEIKGLSDDDYDVTPYDEDGFMKRSEMIGGLQRLRKDYLAGKSPEELRGIIRELTSEEHLEGFVRKIGALVKQKFTVR